MRIEQTEPMEKAFFPLELAAYGSMTAFFFWTCLHELGVEPFASAHLRNVIGTQFWWCFAFFVLVLFQRLLRELRILPSSPRLGQDSQMAVRYYGSLFMVVFFASGSLEILRQL